MNRISWTVLASFCLLICLGPSTAAFGQVIDGTLFDGGAVPGTTVDHVLIDVTAGLTTIDVLSWEFVDPLGPPQDVNGDSEFAFLDPHIYLFRDDGSLDFTDLVDSNDDNLAFPASGGADGSVSVVDPYLEVPLNSGRYIVAVGAAPGFSLEDAIAGSDADGPKLFTIDPTSQLPFPQHDHGDYRISFSDNVTIVPEPTGIVLGAIGFLCVGWYAWRRKRKIA